MDKTHQGNLLTEKEIRTILYACKAKFGLMAHQLESYNHFVQRVLPAIVKENSILVANYPPTHPDGPLRVEFILGDIYVKPPSNKEASGFVKCVTPSASRTRGLTYSSDVEIDIEQRTLRMPPEGSSPDELPVLVNQKKYSQRLLCRLPVMVGSDVCYLQQSGNLHGECPHDDGGYFIVNGMEKVVISQEKLRTNFPYVFPPRKGVSPIAPSIGKTVLTCEVRSSHESKLRSTSTLQLHLIEAKQGAAPEIMAVLPYLECPISLAWLLHLLGWDPVNGGAEEIERLILGDMRNESLSKDSPRASMRLLVQSIARRVETEGRMASHNDILEIVGKKGTHEEDQEKRDRYVRYICCSETLPHMGVDNSSTTQLAKRTYVYHMISKLVAVLLGITQYDDRDHYANKRVDTAGPLIAHLFRQLFRSFLKSLQSQIQKAMNAGKFVDLIDSRIINHKRITGGIKMAFGTGNWGTPKIAGGSGSAIGQVGITQQLSQMTGISATAHGRRLNTPLHKEGRNPHPRQLSNSAWGIVCSTETPEGLTCGLVKNLAWGTRVRIGTPTSVLLPVVMNVCAENSTEPLVTPLVSHETNTIEESRRGAVMVTVNGFVAGYCHSCKDAMILRERLREKRKSFEIPFDTSIAYIQDAWQDVIRIHADAGCLLRPVFNLEHIHKAKSILNNFVGTPHAHCELWASLYTEGIIEYIDKDEENTLRVAERLEDTLSGSSAYERSVAQQQPFTHSEIHPSIIHGVCASLIPFSNHNQSPRNTYQSAMGKQALGIPATNYNQRLDSIMNVLVSPEKPLVATWMDDMTNSRSMPAGQNVMVAIMCHTGFNQEDSLIMCQTSVDAGMFYSLCYRTNKDETRPNGTDIERIEVPNPDACTRMKAASYDHLDPQTGAARVGARLSAGDIVIGKTVETTDSIPQDRGGGKVKMLRDKSQQIRSSEEGEVDRVVISCNQEGQKAVKVRMRQLRVPQIGDKFCYTPDHDILTQRGWVACANVTLDDMALVYDPATKSSNYVPVSAVHQYDLHDEDLCAVCSDGVDLVVTPNHRMYVNVNDSGYDLKKAEDVMSDSGTAIYLKSAERGLATMQSQIPPFPKSTMHDWLLLVGFWKGCKQHPFHNDVMRALPCAQDRITEAADRCKLTYALDETTWEIKFEDEGILSDVFSGTPCLPQWALHMDQLHSQSFLDGFMMVNASCISKYTGKDIIHANTKELADQLQVLAIHAGRASNVATCHTSPLCEVHIVSGAPALQIEDTHRIQKYSGTVHCITAGSGIIYVRRQGKAVWCGNSSRHGQKGVVGMMRHRKDMPFTPEGLTPDIIVNPHAIPSRMTIGHLFETLLGAEAAHMGEFGDGTPFRDLSVEQIANKLEEKGFDRYCDTTLYCGLTGKCMDAKVFYGPTYYQRLKHMVHDKMHARSRGPVAPLTRQPVEGRSREGGLRIGEMERDACVSHGASANVRESLFERSDPYVAHVCKQCGLLCDNPGDHTPAEANGWCNSCSSSKGSVQVPMPFACKLTLQEITALHITPRLKFDKESEQTHEDDDTAASMNQNVQLLVT